MNCETFSIFDFRLMRIYFTYRCIPFVISIADSHVCCHSPLNHTRPQQACLEACKRFWMYMCRKSCTGYIHRCTSQLTPRFHIAILQPILMFKSFQQYYTKKTLASILEFRIAKLKSSSTVLIRSQLWLNTTKTAAWTAHMPNKQLTISCCSASRSWKSKPTCHQQPPRSEGSQPQMT